MRNKEKNMSLGKTITPIFILLLILNPFLTITSLATPPAKYGTHISTEIDSEGFIHVTFSGYKSIYVKIDSETGNVVIPPITLPSDGDGVYPDIAVDSNGCPHIIYHTLDGYQYVKLNRDGDVLVNNEFSLEIPEIYLFSSQSYHIDLDSLDRVYIIWRNGTEINYSLLDIDGNLISENNIEPPDGYEIIVHGSDYEFFVVEGGYSSTPFVWHTMPVSYEVISTTDGRKLIFQEYGPAAHTTKIIDKNGYGHFFYRENVDDDNYLTHYQKASLDGNILISEDSFSGSIKFPTSPRSELDPDGNIHLIWWGHTNNRADVFYVKLNDNGKKFFSPYSITKHTRPSPFGFVTLFVIILVIVLLAILLYTKFIKNRKDKSDIDFDVFTNRSEQVGQGQRRSERLEEDEGKKGHSAE
jgi:hypothetical protein